MATSDVIVETLIKRAIPIFGIKNPHPMKKRPDCNLERDYKCRLRTQMEKELQALVAKYEQKVKEL